ncbi:sugar phosphate nucleotidyltransferase [Sulfitobacter sp. SH24]|uniref:sugar phosphate nucleotidyltransferase n=1 Tax=Sulfitobacter sp. SH24 TaxID=3421173 RepID=UPI003F4F9EDF|tara:strand:+ start:9527 stop:10252 length:726 start_codon:yes stop_codon:yes gene_type:complete
MTHIRKAVFPVAGMGTRFLPATKSIPKEMLPLVDRPLIQYAIDEAREAGIEEFIFVTAAGKGALEDYFDTAAALENRLAAGNKTKALAALEGTRLPEGALAFLRQNNPLGLGHAVRLASRLVGDEPFAVLLPDDVIRAPRGALSQMISAHALQRGHMVEHLGIEGESLRATAINDYAVEIPLEDAVEEGPIIAYKMDGAVMSLRDKGPLWIVYPFDNNPNYSTEVTYARSIWQLDRIEVLD